MKLYGFFNSSTSYRVRIALALKGIRYDYESINIREGEQASEPYRSVNASKSVPLLLTDQGLKLSQSLAIIQYLDDHFPQPRLIPEEINLKSQVLEFSYIIACDIHPINNLRVLKYLTTSLSASSEDKSTWYQHWVSEGLSAAEALLQNQPEQPFCFSDTPTLADICLIPQLANAERFGCDLSPYPRLMSVYRHGLKHPAFISAQPSLQPDFLD
ncbi:maleylacetoacetate isomerase [Vibrio cincinnatiensis]|jgi:maleylacetoacetate isomerase|uniref:Maleylpyruvate isomerase n=1 Tax=Vibrio cincinnatiensis DSM 19608 TaxID=1123491 RepID=A0A1T4S0V6_VIBCI|nr:maleylacetoacetate isomerase [Vibrio cincinnatiensis]MCG3723179.1 maleylacetoacetate isomerase [Vibrio cincinnatiensis]MCG3726162.1 maleylacetoacetate isomerase [Vibrio cincinnatiensis]MCG3765083.1 maleylacetoacetate isomerase [Vibrio cincinnatiensis]SKA21578.1 maleylpyruvate isomerase [Vibrio cincinnatiensis DSM 19608]SUP06705.1 maleylacetoacetate isomerase [Vibrio cincinnatiensis]